MDFFFNITRGIPEIISGISTGFYPGASSAVYQIISQKIHPETGLRVSSEIPPGIP